ncbi:MAG: helix-turn-helix transcriptional regulator [Bacteroidales bacterium]|nr:helix-turn-helix transcriptional regulator [Candidatus Cacconaster scatequi]
MANDGTYSLSPEYWAGWVLAYYQWLSGKSFRYLQTNGLDIEKVIALYHPLHEADLSKFTDTADAIIRKYIKLSESPIKKARERIGITQKELSIRSSVSLRMIRAYEQKKQSLSNAGFSTVSNIASALFVDTADIIQ